MKRFIGLGVLIIVLAGAAFYQFFHDRADAEEKNPELAAILKPNTKAPAFTLKGLNGQTYTMGKHKDKPVILNFWATWCDPCKHEAPALQSIYEKYGDRVDVYGINFTKLDLMYDIDRFVSKYHVRYPILLDPDNKVNPLYGLISYPVTYFIDREGMIRDVHFGEITSKQLEAYVAKLLTQEKEKT